MLYLQAGQDRQELQCGKFCKKKGFDINAMPCILKIGLARLARLDWILNRDCFLQMIYWSSQVKTTEIYSASSSCP